jgi:hypothetical protein
VARSVAERFAGAFVGGLGGFFIGAGIMAAIYVVDPASGLRWRVTAAVVAYCAAFTFVVGAGLGDVIAGGMRLLALRRLRVPYGDRQTPVSTWFYSILLFLAWAALLAAVVFAALR